MFLSRSEARGLYRLIVQTWNTGVFFSDSCGYIVVSHPPSVPRIIIAFRGTYSFANTIVDLTTIPQEYIPYPGDDGDDIDDPGINIEKRRCVNCSVHAGFMTSWRHSRPYIIPYLKELIKKYPDYRLTLVGHSLGGAVAALAALEFEARGWNPQTTTFGEPKIGNLALVKYIDRVFAIRSQQTNTSAVYRRITHINDPVPLLPLREWGYRMHAGEIYISKTELSPLAADIHHCEGDEDPECIAGMGSLVLGLASLSANFDQDVENFEDWWRRTEGLLTIPARFRIWQLFFAHRDYFWRLGLCIPGGDPKNWFRKYDDINSSEL